VKQDQSVRAILRCNAGHEHELCIDVQRGVPQELRCPPSQPQGYGAGNGTGCPVPTDFIKRVQRELRYAFQESKRRGYVLIQA
jgi:hypothetical protein